MIAGTYRGLDFQAMRSMQLGQIIDYCVEYDNQKKKAEKKTDEPEIRKARKGDFARLLG